MSNYHSWLQQVVAPYYDPGRVFRDVDMALRNSASLRPKTDYFSKFGGQPQLLICLFGPIRCGNYQIPIELWVPKGYPRESPYLYVTPSNDIAIRTTQAVDMNGMFTHQLLTMWNARIDVNLMELLKTASLIFASDPPITASSSVPRPNDQSTTTGQLRSALRNRLSRGFKELQLELEVMSDVLLVENSQLEKGENELAINQTKVEELIADLDEEITNLRERKDLMIQMSKDGFEFDLDSFVTPQGKIANQIVNLVADELALQDTIYTISKCFFDGKVPLQSYLKYVRELAREQFMSKVLLLKIRNEFPLIKD